MEITSIEPLLSDQALSQPLFNVNPGQITTVEFTHLLFDKE